MTRPAGLPRRPLLLLLPMIAVGLGACDQGTLRPAASSQSSPAEGLDDLERYLAIQDIKALKARYFRHLDEKEWDRWQEVFAPDAQLVVGFEGDGPGTPENPVVGAAEIVAFVRPSIESLVTVHHGHMPEIEITSPTTARGIWAMEDLLSLPDGSAQVLQGWGHYHETYERIDGQWRIKTLTLTRLRVDAPAGS